MSRLSSALRDKVRKRAGGRCEYCRRPKDAASYPHHVDHIIAFKHGGSDELDNLAWACFHCNTGKGSDLASFDRETETIVPLYNPRTQSWDEHFALEDGMMVGLTPAGRVTVQFLTVNSPNQVEIRRRLILAGVW